MSYKFTSRQKIYLPFKRVFDIVGSIFGILFSFAFLWWWITIVNIFVTKGHPFFAPKRLGKNKKIFKMFKFRTMKYDTPVIPPYEMTEEQRNEYETGFGKLLRKTSLDETLQFFNVLFGQMSLVGPRPGAAEDEEILIVAREKYFPSAYEIKPGMTGFSQVYMKRQHDAMSKAWFDSEYVKTVSLLLDIKIIVHTLLFVFKGK